MIPEGLTIGIIVGAALLDSINPCVFGVLIFLCAFMIRVFKSPGRMLVGGLIYTAVVYISYFLIGLGFLKFTVSFGFSVAVYWVAAIIAIAAGLLEIKDYFWYGKGFSLQMIPGAAKGIKIFTEKNVYLWNDLKLYKNNKKSSIFKLIYKSKLTPLEIECKYFIKKLNKLNYSFDYANLAKDVIQVIQKIK